MHHQTNRPDYSSQSTLPHCNAEGHVSPLWNTEREEKSNVTKGKGRGGLPRPFQGGQGKHSQKRLCNIEDVTFLAVLRDIQALDFLRLRDS